MQTIYWNCIARSLHFEFKAMMIEFSQFSLTQKGKQHANLMRNLTVHRRKSEIRNLEEIRNHLPLYKCLVSPLYWHLWSWKEAKKEQIHGQLSQQIFFFLGQKMHILFYIFKYFHLKLVRLEKATTRATTIWHPNKESYCILIIFCWFLWKWSFFCS